MKRFQVTRRASADLDAIIDHSLRAWGETRTEHYVKALETRFQWLAENPMLGRVRDDVATGYRSFPQGSHLIFYRIDADDIHIIGVPHSAMDLAAFFERDND